MAFLFNRNRQRPAQELTRSTKELLIRIGREDAPPAQVQKAYERVETSLCDPWFHINVCADRGRPGAQSLADEGDVARHSRYGFDKAVDSNAQLLMTS